MLKMLRKSEAACVLHGHGLAVSMARREGRKGHGALLGECRWSQATSL
jgi:hypothetical protein